MQIANLAQLKGGEYKIQYEDEKGQTFEKAINELKDPKDIKILQDYLAKQSDATTAGATADEKLVSIAEKQLDNATKMNIAITELKTTFANTFAGSRAGKMIVEEGLKNYQVVTEGITKELKISSGTLSKTLNDTSTNLKSLFEAVAGGGFEEVKTALLDMPGPLKGVIETAINSSLGGFNKLYEKITGEESNITSYEELKTGIDKILERLNFTDANDFIITEQGGIKTYEKDTIVGLTKGEEFINNTMKPIKTNDKNLGIDENVLKDILSRMVTPQPKEVSGTQEFKHTIEIKLDSKIPAGDSISKAIMEGMSKDQTLIRTIINKTKETVSSGKSLSIRK